MLKRLELVGFKSFADKTIFDFGDGITGIVGPKASSSSIERINDTIAHRGPDGVGTWIDRDGRVGFEPDCGPAPDRLLVNDEDADVTFYDQLVVAGASGNGRVIALRRGTPARRDVHVGTVDPRARRHLRPRHPPARQQHMPIWLGGKTPRSLRRALTFADGWDPFYLTVDELGTLLAKAREWPEWRARRARAERGGVSDQRAFVSRHHDPDPILSSPGRAARHRGRGDRLQAQGQRAGEQAPSRLEGVEAGVAGADVDVAVRVSAPHQLLRGADVVGVGGADEPVRADRERGRQPHRLAADARTEIVAGIAGGKPVGFLLLTIIVLALMIPLLRIKRRRTALGDSELRRLKHENSYLSPKLRPAYTSYGPSLAGLSAAMRRQS